MQDRYGIHAHTIAISLLRSQHALHARMHVGGSSVRLHQFRKQIPSFTLWHVCVLVYGNEYVDVCVCVCVWCVCACVRAGGRACACVDACVLLGRRAREDLVEGTRIGRRLEEALGEASLAALHSVAAKQRSLAAGPPPPADIKKQGGIK